MESPKNTHIELTNLGLLIKEKTAFIEHESEQVKALKVELRKIMIANNTKKFENKDYNLKIKITRSYSFDIGLFKMEMPGFSASFITEEIITTTKDVFDKKRLKERYPDDYNKYLIELTPRLSIK